MADFKDKIALVTGATRGIGRATAIALAKEGAHIYCIGRTVGALEDLDDEIIELGGSATLVPLDLTDGDGIDRLGAAIFERFQRLDILIGNAGILGPMSPLAHIDTKHWHPVMEINVTANWRLIRSMDPLLRKADAGRAVFVTSGAAWKAKAFWGPYGVSKAALDALVGTYATEISDTNIRANLLSPGPTRTKMRAQAMPGEDPAILPEPAEIAASILRLCESTLAANGTIFDHPSGQFTRVGEPSIA